MFDSSLFAGEVVIEQRCVSALAVSVSLSLLWSLSWFVYMSNVDVYGIFKHYVSFVYHSIESDAILICCCIFVII